MASARRNHFGRVFLGDSYLKYMRSGFNHTRFHMPYKLIPPRAITITNRKFTMTTKSLALATSIILFSGFSGAVYAETASPQTTHRVAHSARQIPVEVSRAYGSTVATVDRGPHYHGGPKSND